MCSEKRISGQCGGNGQVHFRSAYPGKSQSLMSHDKQGSLDHGIESREVSHDASHDLIMLFHVLCSTCNLVAKEEPLRLALGYLDPAQLFQLIVFSFSQNILRIF